MTSETTTSALLAAHRLAAEAQALAEAAIARAAELTRGRREHRRPPGAVRAARAASRRRRARRGRWSTYAERLAAAGRPDALTEDAGVRLRGGGRAQARSALREAHPGDFADVPEPDDELRRWCAPGWTTRGCARIGARVIEARGVNGDELDNDDAASDAGVRAPVREAGGAARRRRHRAGRPHPPRRPAHPGVADQAVRRAGVLRQLHARRVRRHGDGLPDDDRADRGAVGGVADRGKPADALARS